MITILFVWTMVAATTHGGPQRDWRPFAELQSPAACHEAARNLNLNGYRCIGKDGTVK